MDSAVESSGKVPKEFKQQMKNWIHDLISTISTRGWNNVPKHFIWKERLKGHEPVDYIPV